MRSNIHLLDCTLRDGGYVNDWAFGIETFYNILEKLYEAGVPIIECGIMGIGKSENTSKFSSFEELEARIADYKHKECQYATILNYSEKNLFQIPKKTITSVDMIRLAFFKSEAYGALEYAKQLIELGYSVCLQAMATSRYLEKELVDLLDKVNSLKPNAFYLVDSFGTMYNDDIRNYYCLFDRYLLPEITLGFHAHNNQQMALSNAIQLIELASNREIAIDASVYGMGRGAGNVNMELLMNFLNLKYSTSYDISKIIDIYEQDLKPIYQQQYWGYSANYFISACEDVNPAYIWYLQTHYNITDTTLLRDILKQLPLEHRHTLNKKVLEGILNYDR